MRTLWLMTSLALHGVAVGAALWFSVRLGGRLDATPPRIELLPRTGAAPSSLQLPPPPSVVIEAVMAPEHEAVAPFLVDSEVAEQVPDHAIADGPAEPNKERVVKATATASVEAATELPPAAEPAPQHDPHSEAAAPASAAVADVEARRRGDNEPPEYPASARRLGQEGAVVVGVEVRADGSVAAVQLAQASPYPLLNREALRAVRGWRFEPALRRGVPVASRTEVTVVFRLRDGR